MGAVCCALWDLLVGFLSEGNLNFHMGTHKGWTPVNPQLGLKAQCFASMLYLVG